MIIGILLGISVVFNIFLFGMLTFLMGQRRKDKKFMAQEIRGEIDKYLTSTFQALDKRMKKEMADLAKGFHNDKKKG